MLLEVCVDSVESAINAERGGACRVELCSALSEGGLTPTCGLLKVVKSSVRVPVFVMIRPRGGDFHYTQHELHVMREDLHMLKDAGADGVVLGALNSSGEVDKVTCQELIGIARPLPVTFHRAIDMTSDLSKALEAVIELGCERVLTSGGESSSLEGTPVIKRLVEQAKGRIVIMPGGGVTSRNVDRILDATGCQELHASCRVSRSSAMGYVNSSVRMGASYGADEYKVKVTDQVAVRTLVQAASGQQ